VKKAPKAKPVSVKGPVNPSGPTRSSRALFQKKKGDVPSEVALTAETDPSPVCISSDEEDIAGSDTEDDEIQTEAGPPSAIMQPVLSQLAAQSQSTLESDANTIPSDFMMTQPNDELFLLDSQQSQASASSSELDIDIEADFDVLTESVAGNGRTASDNVYEPSTESSSCDDRIIDYINAMDCD
jgi:hypothetical protein